MTGIWNRSELHLPIQPKAQPLESASRQCALGSSKSRWPGAGRISRRSDSGPTEHGIRHRCWASSAALCIPERHISRTSKLTVRKLRRGIYVPEPYSDLKDDLASTPTDPLT